MKIQKNKYLLRLIRIGFETGSVVRNKKKNFEKHVKILCTYFEKYCGLKQEPNF